MRKFFLALVSVLGMTAAANACDYGVAAVRVLQVNDHCAQQVQQVVAPVVHPVYAAPLALQFRAANTYAAPALRLEVNRSRQAQRLKAVREVQRVRQVNALRVRGY